MKTTNTIQDFKLIVTIYNSQFNSEELPVNKLTFSDETYSILSTIVYSQSHSYVEPQDTLNEMKDALETGWEFSICQDGQHQAKKGCKILWDKSENDLIFQLSHFLDTDIDYDQNIIDALETIENNNCDDYNLDFDGNEYRLISESSIWGIYVQTIKDTVNDCYDLKLDNIPSFVAFGIDWEQTATNCCCEGYGHTFSSYDGSEENAGGFYIFRTN